jgi:hypothetical protein
MFIFAHKIILIFILTINILIFNSFIQYYLYNYIFYILYNNIVIFV